MTVTPVAPADYQTAVPPRPVPGSILAAAYLDEAPNGHFMLGTDYEPTVCGQVLPIAVGCLPGDVSPDTKVIQAPPGSVAGDTFGLYLLTECKSVGGRWGTAMDRAEAAFTAGEPAGVERALEALFAAGTISGVDVVDVTPAGGAVEPRDGLAAMEQMIGRTGVLGVIHMPRMIASLLAGRVETGSGGTSLSTDLGTPVAAGGGYEGTATLDGGTAPADGERYIYGTGPVVLRRGSVEATGPVLNPSTNDVLALIERGYSVVVECYAYAIKVKATGCCGGEGVPLPDPVVVAQEGEQA